MSSNVNITIPLNVNRCDIFLLFRGPRPAQLGEPKILIEGAEPGLITTAIYASEIVGMDLLGDPQELQWSLHVTLITRDPTKLLSDYVTSPVVHISDLTNFFEVSTNITASQGGVLADPVVQIPAGTPKLVWADLSQGPKWAKTDTPSQWLDVDQTYDFGNSPPNIISWAILDSTPLVSPQNVQYRYTSGFPPEWKLYDPGANAMVSSDSSTVQDGSIAYEYVPPDWNGADTEVGAVMIYIILFADAAATQCIGYLSVELQSYGSPDYVYTLKAWKEGTPPNFDFLAP